MRVEANSSDGHSSSTSTATGNAAASSRPLLQPPPTPLPSLLSSSTTASSTFCTVPSSVHINFTGPHKGCEPTSGPAPAFPAATVIMKRPMLEATASTCGWAGCGRTANMVALPAASSSSSFSAGGGATVVPSSGESRMPPSSSSRRCRSSSACRENSCSRCRPNVRSFPAGPPATDEASLLASSLAPLSCSTPNTPLLCVI
mmetsp:Transcript_10205/g.22645  ORF Transcript_10205/g.22645 Transcript_10205/m.22645 type:complete len:202 (-) Transcript_10205:1463-2068(-)